MLSGTARRAGRGGDDDDAVLGGGQLLGHDVDVRRQRLVPDGVARVAGVEERDDLGAGLEEAAERLAQLELADPGVGYRLRASASTS